MRSRREFLSLSSRTAALCALGPLQLKEIGAGAFIGDTHIKIGKRSQAISYESPFTLGVASGDPTPDGMVLWTRLLTGIDATPEMTLPVRWEVAEDDTFQNVVQTGETAALPQLAHSVHVEIEGLKSGRDYWYRFHAGDATSPTGRTRTAPPIQGDIDQFSFVFTSCQHYERGWYTGFRHMAEESIGLVVHLGDYIYEDGPGIRTDLVRLHDAHETHSLEDYRARYTLYKSDPDLQTAHAAFPWVFTPDDHEVDNDFADNHGEDGTTGKAFLRRRAAAFQALYEHLPLRSTAIPDGPYMRLYRRLKFGRMMQLHVLDTRQYRTPQPCGGGRAVPCPGQHAEGATILGEDQRSWLLNNLDRSSARYNILANQVFMAKLLEGRDRLTLPMDKWDGYPADRQQILNVLGKQRPSNPIVITGDQHTNWVNDLKLDFDRPESVTVGTELVGTSISSSGDGQDMAPQGNNAMGHNPHIKFFNAQRGYVRCEMTTKRLRADYRVMPYVTKPNAPISTRASFIVEDGTPGAQEA